MGRVCTPAVWRYLSLSFSDPSSYFDSPRGNTLGLIAASLFLPSIPSAFVGDFLAQRYGRRVAVWLGSVLIIVGALVNAFANSLGMFIGGWSDPVC